MIFRRFVGGLVDLRPSSRSKRFVAFLSRFDRRTGLPALVAPTCSKGRVSIWFKRPLGVEPIVDGSEDNVDESVEHCTD